MKLFKARAYSRYVFSEEHFPGLRRYTRWLHIHPVFSQLVDTGIQELEGLE